MLIYVLDKDYQTMKESEAILVAFPKCLVKCFADLKLFMDAVAENPPDTVLLDVEKRNRVSAIRELYGKKKPAKIVLLADSDAWAAEAFDLGVSGYIVKPVTAEKLEKQLVNN